MNHGLLSPVVKGGFLALLAAALFGLSTPFVQKWGQGLGPFTTAALLYGGAASVAAFMRKPKDLEAQLQRSDATRLLAMAVFGAVIGPVSLVWGLQHTSGVSASLMLTLEAVFTALLAWRLYGEAVDRRVVMAMCALLAGGMVLALGQGLEGGIQLMGLLAVMAATLAWGIDNSLSRGVADRDPGQVVLAKSVLGLLATGSLAWLSSEVPPAWTAGAVLLLIGASGYGLSLRFYLLAQRTFGAARTGSVFAFAPFMGAAAAFALGERAVSPDLALGGLLMLMGVVLHLAESHRHDHAHEAMEHEHAHTHDDGHHDHDHDHAQAPAPAGQHSHRHRHAPIAHGHDHVPDIHHRHVH